MSTKHDKIISSITSLHELVNNLNYNCNIMFNKLDNKIKKIEISNKKILDNIEKIKIEQNNNLNANVSFVNNNPSFMNIDNKEEYLNKTIKNVPNTNINSYLRTKISGYINSHNIYDLLQKKYDIYEFSTNIIQTIIREHNDICCLYAFPFQKNIVYYWNNNKNSWEKIGLTTLRSIFNTIQKCIINSYTNLIKELQENNEFNSKSSLFMENGNTIFDDGFETKNKIFKKMLFDKICN